MLTCHRWMEVRMGWGGVGVGVAFRGGRGRGELGA